MIRSRIPAKTTEKIRVFKGNVPRSSQPPVVKLITLSQQRSVFQAIPINTINTVSIPVPSSQYAYCMNSINLMNNIILIGKNGQYKQPLNQPEPTDVKPSL